ncbi:ABC transporter permease [Butyrivibrio sp. LC3010]|uniref:ABC transporter permease n=1 Tax=Butyrivibrio sp. LC3010 TaxID=1280680 RepID=UPI000419C766|nr:ABC transporter permease [Butyrivibrio sp. LC3010]
MKSKKLKLKRKVIIAAMIAIILIVVALLAEVIAPNDPYATNATMIRKAPSAEYLFGTDNLGRCVFSRVLYGARTTISSTVFLVAISFFIGTLIGMICGYYGGIVDEVLMRVADLTLAFPQMVVAIAVAGLLDGGLGGAMIALGITMWTSFARLARSHTLTVKQMPFITASRLAGKSGAYIIIRHILPNILEPVLISALTQIGTTMIGISGLSFLGLGVVAPKAEWGSMISEARAYIQIAPWAVLYPAAATIITIVVFNYLGDAVLEYRDNA